MISVTDRNKLNLNVYKSGFWWKLKGGLIKTKHVIIIVLDLVDARKLNGVLKFTYYYYMYPCSERLLKYFPLTYYMHTTETLIFIKTN